MRFSFKSIFLSWNVITNVFNFCHTLLAMNTEKWIVVYTTDSIIPLLYAQCSLSSQAAANHLIGSIKHTENALFKDGWKILLIIKTEKGRNLMNKLLPQSLWLRVSSHSHNLILHNPTEMEKKALMPNVKNSRREVCQKGSSMRTQFTSWISCVDIKCGDFYRRESRSFGYYDCICLGGRGT